MNKKIIIPIILTFIILIAIFGSTFLVRQIQELRKKAAPTYQKTATLELESSNPNPQVGNIFNVEIMINTKDQDVGSVQMALDYSENLEYQGAQVIGNLPEFKYNPNNVLPEQRIIQVAAITTGGDVSFSTATPVSFGTIQFKALAEGTAAINFQSELTKIYGFQSNQDILAWAEDLTLTIGGATVTSTPTPTASPTPTPTTGAAAVEITNITEGQTVNTNRPTFSGTAPPDTELTITLESPEPIIATILADAEGEWSWTPTADLADGDHTLTIIAAGHEDNPLILAFSVDTSGTGGGTPTATPTPTPTTGAAATATPTPTPTTAAPVAGHWQQSALLLGTGLILLILGLGFTIL